MNYKERISKLRAKFDELGVDAFLVSRLENIFYLSGFTGSTAQVVITDDSLLFLTDFRYEDQFYEEVYSEYKLVNFYQESLGAKLDELARTHGFSRLGIESDFVSLKASEEIIEKARAFKVVPCSSVVESFREVKDEDEVAIIREAIGIVEEAFRELVALIRPGVKESDLAAEFEYRIRKRKAKRASFSPIVAFGPNSAKPHAGFSELELIPGVPLTFDLGVSYRGYSSDMTRTVFFGGVSEGWERIYNIVREAKAASANYGKSGMRCAELDKCARAIIEGEGYGENFGHGLGHGVGIEVHEKPRIGKNSEDVLKEGSVITIEPGIYIKRQGGVRIEDMYLVRSDRLERLNNLDDRLMIIA